MNVSIRDAVRTELRYGFRAVVRSVELSGTVILAVVMVAMVFTVTMSRLAAEGRAPLQEVPRPQVITDGRPPIGDCPQEVKLWECIRHAQYLEEKTE